MKNKKTRSCLRAAACRVLATAEPESKVLLTREIATAWFGGMVSLPHPQAVAPTERPARPIKPQLVAPREVPKRTRSRPDVLLHAIAHIELNAIDLAWDLIARFGNPTTPRTFFDD